MRTRYKSWQSDRPLKVNSRRVVMFKPDVPVGSWRLEFLDENGKANAFFSTKDLAEVMFEAYKKGNYTSLEIRKVVETPNWEEA